MKESALILDIMTQYVITVSPNTTVDVILDIFETNPIHHLPVVQDKQLVGIISKIDVFKMTHCIDLFRSKANEDYNKKLLQSLLAEEVMTNDVVTLAPHNSIYEAATLFSQNKYHAIPIVEHEKLVGIITTFDLIEYAFNEKLKPAM